jgi:alpha-acetolactate decarboxylase
MLVSMECFNGDEMTPYATITRFEADQTYQTSNKNSEKVLNEVFRHHAYVHFFKRTTYFHCRE